MEWRAQGTVLSARRHGESAAIIDVFTRDYGRYAGMVRGGGGRRMAPILQAGALLDLTWRARLADHLGSFTVEPVRGRAAAAMGDRVALAGLSSVTALAAFVLPERQAYPALFGQTETVLDLIADGDEHWPFAYLRWEAALLAEMGFGLDLGSCAVTGATDGLIYVSPRTGRAVSAEGAGAWVDRLLPLPPCLAGEPPQDLDEICTALGTTGHFLTAHLGPSLGEKPLPEARARLLTALARRAAEQDPSANRGGVQP